MSLAADVNAGRGHRKSPPWSYIDPGIVELVRAFFHAGLTPFASCQGGEGHLFPCPTVLLECSINNDQHVAARAQRLLQRWGFRRFTIARVARHQGKETPLEKHVVVEIGDRNATPKMKAQQR